MREFKNNWINITWWEEDNVIKNPQTSEKIKLE